jgi:Ca2+-binding EF-hand superfamily protein
MGSSSSNFPELPDSIRQKAVQLFNKMDSDGSGSISTRETLDYFKGNHETLNKNGIFEDVDDDGNGKIELNEWLKFWNALLNSGMSEDDIILEVTISFID